MKYFVILSLFIVLLLSSCSKNKTAVNTDSPELKTSSQIEMQDTLKAKPDQQITAEMAYEGVNNYCHSTYDWSVAESNPSMMYVTMGEETDSAYQVVFRSYTGAFVHFYVEKTSGATRMVERVPNLNVESEAGTIDLFDYLEKNN